MNAIFIVQWDISDYENHSMYQNFFLSLEEALKYCEEHYTYHFEFNELVSIYEVYPEYDYMELIYSYEPPYYDIYAEYSQEDLEPEDDHWYIDPYYRDLDEMAEEDNLEAECEEWMTQNHNLPWDYQTMSKFLRLYNDWGYRFGHPIYQTSGHKFRAFKWHIDNDRVSTKLLKAFYQKLSRLYGEEFVDRFIK